uniref:Uncharacterized protein n=1 Tax=Arundo donax TaxID=35708 RepID=A0A0A8XRA6_ARUDO
MSTRPHVVPDPSFIGRKVQRSGAGYKAGFWQWLFIFSVSEVAVN